MFNTRMIGKSKNIEIFCRILENVFTFLGKSDITYIGYVNCLLGQLKNER